MRTNRDPLSIPHIPGICTQRLQCRYCEDLRAALRKCSAPSCHSAYPFVSGNSNMNYPNALLILTDGDMWIFFPPHVVIFHPFEEAISFQLCLGSSPVTKWIPTIFPLWSASGPKLGWYKLHPTKIYFSYCNSRARFHCSVCSIKPNISWSTYWSGPKWDER